MRECILVDLGKTNCSAARADDPSHRGVVPGAPGLSAAGGVRAALAQIVCATDALGRSGTVISVGAAGAIAAPDAADELAHRLVAEQGYAEAIVTSDAVTAHVGALSGEPGVVAVAGTGAVALAVATSGAITVADGAGPGSGDVGSGGWIGAEALRLAFAGDGTLAAVAQEVLGADWRQVASGSGAEMARRHGGLVPHIAELARSGDQTAYALLERSALALASTITRAVRAMNQDVVDVCVLGGLLEIGAPWTTVLRDRLSMVEGARLRDPDGDALHGAALLIHRRDLPHESHVHRAMRCDE